MSSEAIDRSLTDRQARELRAISTRAAISRTSFSNYYTFGDLKANPRDLVVKYFDASLYFANWLFLEVAFRYPRGALDFKTLHRYATGHPVEVRSTGPDVIVAISVESDGETFDTAEDATSWLSSLVALRADIAAATTGCSIWAGCSMSAPERRQIEAFLRSLSSEAGR
jgi:hypothetical protein